METHENIKALRELRGLSQEALAAKVGYKDRSSIAKIESGIVDLSQSKIAAFAAALGVTPAYLMGIEDTPDIKGIAPIPSFHKVPRLGIIACGDPILAEENIESYDDVPDYIQADFTLVCHGDSMIGARIHDGDIVCVRQQPSVDNGSIAAVLIDEEATLKRVFVYKDHVVLQPENPDYKPLSLWEEDMNRVRILGLATHFISTVK